MMTIIAKAGAVRDMGRAMKFHLDEYRFWIKQADKDQASNDLVKSRLSRANGHLANAIGFASRA